MSLANQSTEALQAHATAVDAALRQAALEADGEHVKELAAELEHARRELAARGGSPNPHPADDPFGIRGLN